MAGGGRHDGGGELLHGPQRADELVGTSSQPRRRRRQATPTGPRHDELVGDWLRHSAAPSGILLPRKLADIVIGAQILPVEAVGSFPRCRARVDPVRGRRSLEPLILT